MRKTCPCCSKEFTPPAPSISAEEDIGNLFSCPHCQSVLKWAGDLLKIVHESKINPEEDNLVEKAEEHQQDEVEKVADFVVDEIKQEQKEHTQKIEEPLKGQGLQKIEDTFEDSEENFEAKTRDHKFSQQKESYLENYEKNKEEKEEVKALNEEEKWEINEEEDEGQETSQDFSDVEEYGNAQASSEKGFLRYDVYISGLDSVEIEKQVREVLEDPRFKWDVNDVLKSQNKGCLVIKNLNPVKAACLVSDLSFLSVKISWKQYMALNVKPEQVQE